MNDNSFYSKYKYIKKLGHGGCGDVFLAQNVVLGNMWAVKEITKNSKTSISGYIEPEILKRLNHPALPRICDIYEDENKIYIVEDYLEGACLKQVLDEKGKFDEQTVIDWAIQLCSVLEYLHSQKPNAIIYSDMKPHNIILTKEGFVKLVDFGISSLIQERYDSENGIDSTKYNNKVCFSENRKEYSKNYKSVPENRNTIFETEFIGTKGYAAPEQFIGNGISRATDIYSLGITIIQLLTGIDPLLSIKDVQNESYAQQISPELYIILKRCIYFNPKLRYKSAGILMKDLKQYRLCYCTDNDYNAVAAKGLHGFTKVLTVTGARATGVSTITAAMAQYIARGPTSVCIVDLSVSSSLEKGILNKTVKPVINETKLSSEIFKVRSNLYYTKLTNRNLIGKNYTSETNIFPDNLMLQNQLGQLQKSFSYLILDVDITLLKYIEQYSNNIYIVSDMNPFNLSCINEALQSENLTLKCISNISFIINKYYMGEMSSRSLLQSSILADDVSQELQELIISAKTFEVPYEQKVYLSWIYSFFGEALHFSKSIDDNFKKSIQNIISQTILPPKNRKPHFIFKKLISKVVT